MREIKFRAWDKENKKIVYSNEVYPRSEYKFEFEVFTGFKFELTKMVERFNVKDQEGNEHYIECFDTVDSEIMQYIGIKDIDNVEIYEGDIVKIFERMAGEDFIGKVIYDESEGCYWIMEGNERNHCKVTFDLEDYSHYVIGNIYENPELLG